MKNELMKQYLFKISSSMKELINMRRQIFFDFAKKLNFSKKFNLIQFSLIIVAETGEDYIPYHARVPGVPGTLYEIRLDNGRNIDIGDT